MAIIAPSLLAADFLHLGDACILVNESPAEWFHLDVMDGRFVPNISYGPSIVQSICSTTDKFCDVHLMIEEPEKYVDDFKNAGASQLTVHYEACPHLHRNIQQIKNAGMKAGVALNPHTPVHLLHDILQDIDTVLIMSVNPGFGGQSFIHHTLEKLREISALKKENGYTFFIEVDGGIDLKNAASVIEAGAEVLVAGSSVFKAAAPMEAIIGLQNIK